MTINLYITSVHNDKHTQHTHILTHTNTRVYIYGRFFNHKDDLI